MINHNFFDSATNATILQTEKNWTAASCMLFLIQGVPKTWEFSDEFDIVFFIAL